jgi:nitrite reductase/ring-hydroxylating ferredoxin subunit
MTVTESAASVAGDGGGSPPPPPPSSLQTSVYARALGFLEEMSWLESLGHRLDTLLQPVSDQRSVMDMLHGRWLGHALHPVLSDLPIGFWVAVPLLDAIGDDGGAAALTAAGCAAAVATAATGTADWTVSDGREKRLGLLHGLVNAAGLALQVGSLAARARGRRRAGRLLTFTGLGVSTAAAFVGGELVFGRGLMVDHTAWQAGPAEWTSVLDEATLREGHTHAVDVEGRKVLLARVDGAVCAMEDACSHAGGPLAEGTVEDGIVQCPWHGSRFRLRDGAVVGSPATFPQLRLESRVVNGRVQVRGRQG